MTLQDLSTETDLVTGRAATRVTETITWGTVLSDTRVTVYFVPRGESRDGYTSEGFNAYEIGQFTQAFRRIANVSGLQFSITDDPDADFQLVLDTNEMDRDTLGYFGPPGYVGAGIGVFNGAIWDRAAGGDLEQGGRGFATIMHELLHGVGLAHPHDDGGGSPVMPGVSAPFDDYGNGDLNQGVFTTMSYNAGYQTGTFGSAPHRVDYGHEAGPMALDIAVLQQLYGTGRAYHTGDDTFYLPETNRPGTMWRTIWDSAGTDEIRYSGPRDVTIDLRPAQLSAGPGAGGFISAANGVAGGFTIAAGTRIEQATGGRGDDKIIGNGAANLLQARAGDDRVYGREGSDRMLGGDGRDVMWGGSGGDALSGNHGHDVLGGEGGRDRLNGGTGRDRLIGGQDSDQLTGGRGEDVFDFNRASESRAGRDHRDLVTDFAPGQDHVDLRGLDADWTTPGNQAFRFINGAEFSAPGQLRLLGLGRDRLAQMDMDGDGRADVEIMLLDTGRVTATDFIL